MTRKINHYRTAALITAALSLGIAAPAGARPFNRDSQGSFVPVNINPPAVQSVAPSGGDGGISDLGYVGIGTGGVAVALIGAGGVRTATRRRRREDEPRLAAGALTER
jgi:hypothetical protein